MTHVDINTLARIGARVRLAELAAERDALLKQFPGLAAKAVTPTPEAAPEKTAKPKRKRRKKMSKEQRKAASDRMKAYWAKRRAAQR